MRYSTAQRAKYGSASLFVRPMVLSSTLGAAPEVVVVLNVALVGVESRALANSKTSQQIIELLRYRFGD
jgi:hypothetical protein